MISKIEIVRLLILCLPITIGACEQKSTHQNTKQIVIKKSDSENKKTKKDLISISSKYKDHVCGIDEDGNNVQGHITVEGENGIGILIDNKGHETEIVFEILNRKKIIATDIEGFKYNLKID
tara:strand:- start:4786 stop:5151 length:366 start_codon:yes stop_codon:yes gene_type:complete